MILAPQPQDEFLRMQALRELNILDSECDARFDCITEFAAEMFDVPICLVSLIDVDRQWFKSAHGLDVKELLRKTSICGHAICEINPDDMHERIFEVSDTKEDERFFDNPLVTGEPWIRSYMGYVLRSETAKNIGTLCVIDTVPRTYSNSQKQLLTLFGGMVENLISRKHYLEKIERRFK